MRMRLFLALVALELAAACYPTLCDPAKDPLRCECPPGPCGPYPSPGAARDAGADR